MLFFIWPVHVKVHKFHLKLEEHDRQTDGWIDEQTLIVWSLPIFMVDPSSLSFHCMRPAHFLYFEGFIGISDVFENEGMLER